MSEEEKNKDLKEDGETSVQKDPKKEPSEPREAQKEPPADAPKEEKKPEEKSEKPPADAPKEEKKPEKVKPTNCTVCNKAFKFKRWYYRNGKYFCSKRCWKKFQAEQKKEAEEAEQEKAKEEQGKKAAKVHEEKVNGDNAKEIETGQ